MWFDWMLRWSSKQLSSLIISFLAWNIELCLQSSSLLFRCGKDTPKGIEKRSINFISSKSSKSGTLSWWFSNSSHSIKIWDRTKVLLNQATVGQQVSEGNWSCLGSGFVVEKARKISAWRFQLWQGKGFGLKAKKRDQFSVLLFWYMISKPRIWYFGLFGCYLMDGWMVCRF